MHFVIYFIVIGAQSFFVVLISIVLRQISRNRYDYGLTHNRLQKTLILIFVLIVLVVYAFELKVIVSELLKPDCSHKVLCYFSVGLLISVVCVVLFLAHKTFYNFDDQDHDESIGTEPILTTDAAHDTTHSFISALRSNVSTHCFAFKVTSYNMGLRCKMCKSKLEEGSIAVRFMCKHVFDEKCVDAYMDEKSNCPVCSKISSKQENASEVREVNVQDM